MGVHVPHLSEIMCMARDSGPTGYEQQAKDNFFFGCMVVSGVVDIIHGP